MNLCAIDLPALEKVMPPIPTEGVIDFLDDALPILLTDLTDFSALLTVSAIVPLLRLETLPRSDWSSLF